MTFDTTAFEIGKTRIEALSDGIFAIVMTLLILEIHVPNLPLNTPNVEVAPALLALWPKFVSYLVTFVSLGFFWVGHHIMYHAIRRADRTLLWLNIFFFMFVSLLPFSTSLLNAFSEAFIAPLFFGANLAIIGWILFFQWSYANSQPNMLADFVSAEYRKTVSSRMLIVPVATTLTVFICFWSVGISLAIYLLLLPLYMLPGKLGGAKSLSALLTVFFSIAASSARLYAQQDSRHIIDVVRLDRRFDKLVPLSVKIEKLAVGHKWVEGPVWNRKGGYLLFSDIPKKFNLQMAGRQRRKSVFEAQRLHWEDTIRGSRAGVEWSHVRSGWSAGACGTWRSPYRSPREKRPQNYAPRSL